MKDLKEVFHKSIKADSLKGNTAEAYQKMWMFSRSLHNILQISIKRKPLAGYAIVKGVILWRLFTVLSSSSAVIAHMFIRSISSRKR